MKTVSISELKASLSEFLSIVRRGEDVLVTDRGVPVARLVRVEGARGEEERRSRLAREGILRLRKGALGAVEAPPGEGPSGVLDALLQERGEGR